MFGTTTYMPSFPISSKKRQKMYYPTFNLKYRYCFIVDLEDMEMATHNKNMPGCILLF